MSVQTKQLRREIREASEENTLKQNTIDNLKSKQQKVNLYIQKLNTKIESLKTDLKNSKTNADLEEGITTKSENTELERKIKELEQINSSLEDNNNKKINETLNIKANEQTRTLRDLKSHN